MKGFPKKCIALAAPSGGGKTTLCRMLLKKYPFTSLSISYTTRAPRGEEKDGVEYHFVSKQRFEELIRNNELLEWALVHGNYYGTSRAFIEQEVTKGRVVLLDMDVQGVDSMKAAFGPQALSIFILPPDLEALEKRLRDRKTESDEKILARLEAAKAELVRAEDFDYRIVNHTINESFAELCEIVERELGL